MRQQANISANPPQHPIDFLEIEHLICAIDTDTGIASRVRAMKRKRPKTRILSRTAEIELERLTALCRKLSLSAPKIRKLKRIAQIMFEA